MEVKLPGTDCLSEASLSVLEEPAMSFQGQLIQPPGCLVTRQTSQPRGQRPGPGGRSSACVPTSTSMR